MRRDRSRRCAPPALHKSFGSLVVAHDVAITLPQGARYALIGPNGAGKTTLINLITGALRPDAGNPARRGGDHRAEPDRRVKRGLARTFQINTLFPDLTPLEAVTLAVCERLGVAGSLVAAPAGYRDAVDEAYEILASLTRRRLLAATRELAYGQQRLLEIALALATRRKCCCSMSPRPACRARKGGELFEAIANLSSDITVLFIEHDMEVVFRFASRVIVMVGGRILVEGRPAEIAADPRVREVYLGGSRHG